MPTAQDIEGTRHNMLSESVLQKDKYPFVQLQIKPITAALPTVNVAISVRLRNQTNVVEDEATVVLSGGQLVANGDFEIQQSDFGIEPFSVLLGALKVEDKL